MSVSMHRIAVAIGALLAGAACSAKDPDPPKRVPDFIVQNAIVYTADPAMPRATAFAVALDRFVAVGSDEQIGALAGPSTDVIDAAGAAVLPGLIDGHTHLLGGIDLVRGVDLYGVADRALWMRKIAARAAELPEGQWLVGGRWDHTLAGDALPTRAELDAVTGNRPAVLRDVDGHAVWLNTTALSLVGIDASTPDPEDGRILRDPANGEPTGILLEGAMALALRSSAFLEGTALDETARLDALEAVFSRAASLGLTGAHEMAALRRLPDYEALAETGRMPLRIWFGFYPEEETPEDLPAIAERARSIQAALGVTARLGGPQLALGYMKLSADGVLSTHTAALLEPYADRPGERGLPLLDEATLARWTAAANTSGFPVAIHAIGDRGVRMALDAFAASPNQPSLPNRVEHIELYAPEDLSRFAAQRVVASMNPHHAVTTFHNYLTERIGANREPYAYAWADIAATGASLVFGSDYPTSPLSPFEQLWSATRRVSAFGRIAEPWRAEQALSFDAALFAYTQAPAEAAGWGDALGSISPGKFADFVLLSGPLPEDLRDARVAATFVSGRATFRLDEASDRAAQR